MKRQGRRNDREGRSGRRNVRDGRGGRRNVRAWKKVRDVASAHLEGAQEPIWRERR